tara:strand:- start:1953 stop:2135 length:183 start_codon:yes stop_codon:yes gene_type:complete
MRWLELLTIVELMLLIVHPYLKDHRSLVVLCQRNLAERLRKMVKELGMHFEPVRLQMGLV